MGEIAGANTALLGGCLHSTKTRARWAEGFHDLNGHVFDMERDGLRQVVLCPRLNHAMTTYNHTIPDRSPPGSTRTAPSAGGVKCATGASSKIRGRDNITIGTWNTRTLRAAGKLQKLTYEMDRYRWNILGLCEMRWKNFGETTTEEGHKVFFNLKKR